MDMIFLKKMICILAVSFISMGTVQAEVFYQDDFDNDTLAVNSNGIGGCAINNTIQSHSWTDDGDASFITNGMTYEPRALFYSENAFESDEGFKLTVYFTTGSEDNTASDNFSFGLISSDADLATYTGYNPFAVSTNVYSLGINLAADDDATMQGLNFTDGTTCTTLDQAGDYVQFTNVSSWVILDIGQDGAWQYSVNGVTEASGEIAEGFDLSKSYHVVVYGQDNTSKSIQSLQLETYDPHLGLGERADWLQGSWGALWLPEKCYNGNIEGVTITNFVAQIADLRTIDYVQVALACPSIYSPVHMAPHDIIESLWEGDTDDDGFPLNLCCPRSTVDDPFLSWIEALNATGLKVEVYVNSYNLLIRNEDSIPAAIADVSERWMTYCDTNDTVQAFLSSESYYTNAYNPDTGDYTITGYTNRPYMFAYAEFILKEYAVRYGDLIDAWCFDSADNIMEDECGDDPDSGVLNDQRVYEAFANAVHAGNPDAAVTFNNSVGTASKPFSTPTLFEDYTFGHPFGGAGDMVETDSLYSRNFGICEYMRDTGGYPFSDDSKLWNDKVAGHFFPKQSTTSWNSGSSNCLTNAEFVEWTSVGITNGGAITWGTPLVIVNLENSSPNLTLQDFALEQLELADDSLSLYQFPNIPNWRRSDTPLPDATIGETYVHSLTNGVDFWDPSGESISDLICSNAPAWLTVAESSSGVWTLSGTPTETEETMYNFYLKAMVGSIGTSRSVELQVSEESEALNISTTNLDIYAAATTNYGFDAVATFFSAIQTNGLATFQVSFDVHPKEGTAIRSGDGGGATTSQSWGIYSSGESSPGYMIFSGNQSEYVNTITNLQVVNFNANGDSLTLDDVTGMSFTSVDIADAQSASKDSVRVSCGAVTNNLSNLNEKIYSVDLEALFAISSVPQFSVGTSSTSAYNKWSVNSIEIEYSVCRTSVTYSTWASAYALSEDDSLATADVEADGYDNFAEFALGMNPTNSDAGSRDWIRIVNEDGTNWFEYLHYRRTDYASLDLTYLLLESSNLVDAIYYTNTQDQVQVGLAFDGYEPVTNRYIIDACTKFVELEIKQN